ncbi:MAG: hypothetical protein NZX77_11255 [Polyangiaceae bacterium]|nr:hypothetical protein [Polyangiaceae bacterium]
MSFAILTSCGNAFEPASSIQSLRILAVRNEEPYTPPGGTASLSLLYFDGSRRAFDAQGNRKRKPQILWLGGCFNPPGDLYYGCFPILAQLFASRGQSPGAPPPGEVNPLEYISFNETFQLKIPKDIIARRPPEELDVFQTQGIPPYGLSYVFFAVCGGEIRPVPSETPSGLPLGCFDKETNERLGEDDFVIGYLPIYSFEKITNKNPVIEGVQFEGVPAMNRPCTEGCAQGSRCGSQGVCIPVIPHCTERKVDDCPTYKIKPVLMQEKNVEKDEAAPPFNGRIPDEVIWASFYASDGTLKNDTALINDANKGWVFHDAEGTRWSAPNATAGESRVWIVVRDNRGGTTWTWQDIYVE